MKCVLGKYSCSLIEMSPEFNTCLWLNDDTNECQHDGIFFSEKCEQNILIENDPNKYKAPKIKIIEIFIEENGEIKEIKTKD